MKKSVLAQILILAFLCCLLGGCTGETGLSDKIYTGAVWTNSVEPGGEQPVVKNNRFLLYLDGEMAVRLVDVQTGKTWTTNGTQKTEFAATQDQFTLSYYDHSGTFAQMSSTEDSVHKGQTEAFVENGSLLVRYRLGDYEQTVDDVPSQLSDKRFKSKLYNRLDTAGKKELESYYRYYESEDVWRIRSKGKNSFKNILALMRQAGYTAEDLTKDNEENGVDTVATIKPHFTVVLKYTLAEDGLQVSVPAEYMEFLQEYPPYELKLLEGFGLTEQSDEGYLLLPDGSGTLMPFATNYDSRSQISLPVYGLDLTVTANVLQNNKQSCEKVLLPVFGIKDGDAACLAVIDSAESNAIIYAHQAGTYFSRNSAYVSFRLIEKDTIYLSGNDNNSNNIPMFESKLFSDPCTVTYHILPQNSGYADMGVRLRELWQASGRLIRRVDNAQNVPLMIETISGVRGHKSFLGFSYTGVVAATSFSENQQMMQHFYERGLTRLDWKVTGWFNGGYYHDFVGKLKIQRELGGKKALSSLIEYADSIGAAVYPDVEFQTFSNSAIGFMPMIDGARTLDFSPAQVPVLSPATQSRNNSNSLIPSTLYVYTPSKLVRLTEKFLSKFQKLDCNGISLRSSGSDLYSDYRNSATVDRTQSQAIVSEHLSMISNKVERVMISGACAYALPYAGVIAEVPTESSHYRQTDCDVPFYQIVMHGSSTMYGAAMNLKSNTTDYRLRLIEYGMYLNYQLTAQPSQVLKNTEINTNYTSCYSDWEERILADYHEVNAALKSVQTAYITNHRQVADEVYCTVYDNKTKIYVNYSNADVLTADGTVPAGGFLVAAQ